MSQGVAKAIEDQFGHKHFLQGIKVRPGGIIAVKDYNREVIYLVTKNLHFHKPKLTKIRESFVNLSKHLLQNKTFSLSIPALASGHDLQHFPTILKMLKDILRKVFKDHEFYLTIYYR